MPDRRSAGEQQWVDGAALNLAGLPPVPRAELSLDFFSQTWPRYSPISRLHNHEDTSWSPNLPVMATILTV